MAAATTVEMTRREVEGNDYNNDGKFHDCDGGGGVRIMMISIANGVRELHIITGGGTQ